MLTAEGLTYRYRGGEDVLKSVSFSLESGRFLAILGNNGVGKSTLLKCVGRLLRADSGEVTLDGEKLSLLKERQLARRIAFLSQSVPSVRMTVQDMVMLGRRPYMRWGFSQDDFAIVRDAMDRVGIRSELRGRFLDSLSGGERQMVMLARALAQRPKVLLLDEPTSSLDIKNQYQVMKLVKDVCRTDGITALAVLHELNLALRFCDSFLLLRQGEVYRCGGIEAIDGEALSEAYGVAADVAEVAGQKTVIIKD